MTAGPRRADLARALAALAPRLPRYEREAVLDHAEDSPGLRKGSAEAAAWLSLVSYARHVFTDYDALLADGYDTDSARFFILEELNERLAEWGVRRRVE